MKTSELTGAALDWAVAKAEGWSNEGLQNLVDGDEYPEAAFSTDWDQGGRIIERYEIAVTPDDECGWQAYHTHRGMNDDVSTGPTLLIAAMRCYVASKLGDEVELPKELTGE